MRKRNSSLEQRRQANGFVNRRPGVQSPAPAQETRQVRNPEQRRPVSVPGDAPDVQRADWILRAVADYGVPLSVAVRAEGRLRQAKRLPPGRRERACLAVAAWMFGHVPAERKAVAS